MEHSTIEQHGEEADQVDEETRQVEEYMYMCVCNKHIYANDMIMLTFQLQITSRWGTESDKHDRAQSVVYRALLATAIEN